MDKPAIRLLVQEKISHMSADHKQQESKNVCTQLTEILSKKEFNTVITYQAFPDEVDISEIGDWYYRNGKKVLTIPQSTEAFEVPDNAIIIIPGRAFTKEGKRIGRGSGYYDKLIGKNSSLQTIGVCFDCQIFPELPQNLWDKRMDEVVFAGNTLE